MILTDTCMNDFLMRMVVRDYIDFLQMKKRSTSSLGSDKSQEGQKREKKLVTFQYTHLNCFMSTASQKSGKNMANPNNKCNPRPPQTKLQPSKEQHKGKEELKGKEEQKSNFSQLRVPRRNKGKVPSNSQQAFNNSILLLEYENQEEPRVDSNHKSKERRESPKSQEEDQMVSAIVHSCMRVITQDTEHSSNPMSARYTTPEAETADLAGRMNASYSASNMPMMVQMSDGFYYYLKTPAVRNRRAVTFQESRAYVIDVDRIKDDGRTTIMIRNIPNKYTQDMLLQRFEENHKKKFDFFYLPIDYNNNCNVGYAFLNFIHTKFIQDFYREFHNHTWEKFNSTKVCQVCYARIQGTAQLEHHFEHSNVIQQKDKRYRPLIGLKSLTDNIQTLVNKQKEGKKEEEADRE